MSMFIFFVQQILLFATPLIVAGIGGMFCERGGIINIGVEGMMIIGAFCGCLFLHFVPAGMPSQLQLIVALLIAAAAGVVFALLHAMASINFSANQAISGIALNIAAPAVSIFAARLIIGRQQISFSNVFRIEAVPGLSKIPVLGDIFFKDVYISFYIAVAVAILGGILINRTRFGLRLKACGEFPQAADSVGVNVYRMRYMGCIICGALAGMAGVMLVVPTATEFNATVAGYGFLAVSVLIFGQWRPGKVVFAAFFFGIMKTLSAVYSTLPFFSSLNVDAFIYRMIPFVVTLIVLSISSKDSQGPAAAGQPYDKSAR